mmetsp:Transcript_6784/g.14480  ORF Transcript_6784/g.14480 Transcript_6784/m.14480 type:complete len:92 (+) Transcript_6784:3-278(+)
MTRLAGEFESSKNSPQRGGGRGRRTGVLQVVAWVLFLASLGYVADGLLNDKFDETLPLATADAVAAAALTFIKTRLDARNNSAHAESETTE